ncbi:hypothetical protein C9374_006810 [Naegleria lovaniensis]|uniref:Uncharacterized protein n=1 Tax=Naegleria lovaniensis TaxID=51637 RepID=A0AA88KS36_NAELO|nr:uncharacterized protein C9374_006810 [Naegleria lovaniensis]KAG2393279.1 hypothetical protein C9374_006810 [Naegleria lovaniensis]
MLSSNQGLMFGLGEHVVQSTSSERTILKQQVRECLREFSRTQSKEADAFLQEFKKRDDAWEILFDILLMDFNQQRMMNSIPQDENERFICSHLIYMKMLYSYQSFDVKIMEWVRCSLLKSIALFYNRYLLSGKSSDKLVTRRLLLALAMFSLYSILANNTDLEQTDIFADTFRYNSHATNNNNLVIFDIGNSIQNLQTFDSNTLFNALNGNGSFTITMSIMEPALEWFSLMLEQMESVNVFENSEQAELKKEFKKMEEKLLTFVSNILMLPLDGKEKYNYFVNLKINAISILKNWVVFGISPKFIYQNDTLLQILYSIISTRNIELFFPTMECVNEIFNIYINSKHIGVIKKYLGLTVSELKPIFEQHSVNLSNETSYAVCREIIKLCVTLGDKGTEWLVNMDAIRYVSTHCMIPSGLTIVDEKAKQFLAMSVYFTSVPNISLAEAMHAFWYHLQNCEIDFVRIGTLDPTLSVLPELQHAVSSQFRVELIEYFKPLLENTIAQGVDDSVKYMGLITTNREELDTFRDSTREVFVSGYYILREEAMHVCEEKLLTLERRGLIQQLTQYMTSLPSLFSSNECEYHIGQFAQLLVSTLPDFGLLESIFYSLNSFGDMIRSQEAAKYFGSFFSMFNSLQTCWDLIEKALFEKVIVGMQLSSFAHVKKPSSIFSKLESHVAIPIWKSMMQLIDRFSAIIAQSGENAIIWCINFTVNSITGFKNALKAEYSMSNQKRDNNVKALMHMSAASFSSLCEQVSSPSKAENTSTTLLRDLVLSMHDGHLLDQFEQSVSQKIYKGLSHIIVALSQFPSTQEHLLQLLLKNIVTNIERLLTERQNSLTEPILGDVYENEKSLQTSIALHFEIRKIKSLLYAFDTTRSCEEQNDDSILTIMLKLFDNILHYTVQILYLFVKKPSMTNTNDVSLYLSNHWGRYIDQHLICNHISDLWKVMITTVGCKNPLTYPFLHKVLLISCQFFCFGKVIGIEQAVDENQLLNELQLMSSHEEPSMNAITQQLQRYFVECQPYAYMLDVIGILFADMKDPPFPQTFMTYFTPIFVLSYNLSSSNIFENRLEWMKNKRKIMEEYSPYLRGHFSEDERGDLLIALFRLFNFTWTLYPENYLTNSLHHYFLEDLVLKLIESHIGGGLDSSQNGAKSVSNYISTFVFTFSQLLSLDNRQEGVFLRESHNEIIKNYAFHLIPLLLKYILLTDNTNVSQMHKTLYGFFTYNKMYFVTCAVNFVMGHGEIQQLITHRVLSPKDLTDFSTKLTTTSTHTTLALRNTIKDFQEVIAKAINLLKHGNVSSLTNAQESDSDLQIRSLLDH